MTFGLTIDETYWLASHQDADNRKRQAGQGRVSE
jgi:hypothetical protein